MDPSLSPFQTLPLHIVEQIARFYVETPRSSSFEHFTECEDTNNQQEWYVLYNLSRSWRSLVYTHYFNKAMLYMQEGINGTSRCYFEFPEFLKFTTSQLRHSYVKKVEIWLYYFEEGYSRFDPLYFSFVYTADLVYHSAHTLIIDISSHDYGLLNYGEVTLKTDFNQLAQRIKSAIPNLRRIVFSYNTKDIPNMSLEMLIPPGGWDAAQLLRQFNEKAILIKSMDRQHFIHRDNQFLQLVTCVTSMSFKETYDEGDIRCLLTRFAPILESLTFDQFYPVMGWKLLLGTKDQPLVYPRLRKLSASGSVAMSLDRDTFATDTLFVPFPNLRYLKWDWPFMVKDDTLFRGNYETLEYLGVRLDFDRNPRLAGFEALWARKFPKLVRISIDFIKNSGDRKLPEFCSELLSKLVSPATQYLSVRNPYVSFRNGFHISPASIRSENIQVLSLDGIKMGIVDAIEIIRGLPRLRKFLSSAPADKISLQEIVLDKPFIESTNSKKYYPLNTNLQSWEVLGLVRSLSMPTVAVLSLALAVLCPKFTLTTLPDQDMPVFGAMVRKEASQIKSCKEHVGNIDQLVRRICQID